MTEITAASFLRGFFSPLPLFSFFFFFPSFLSLFHNVIFFFWGFSTSKCYIALWLPFRVFVTLLSKLSVIICLWLLLTFIIKLQWFLLYLCFWSPIYLDSFTVVIPSFKVVATEVTYAGMSLDVRSYILLNTDFYVIALVQTTCSASVMITFDLTEV